MAGKNEHTVRVGDDTAAHLFNISQRLGAQHGRRFTLGEVVALLIREVDLRYLLEDEGLAQVYVSKA